MKKFIAITTFSMILILSASTGAFAVAIDGSIDEYDYDSIHRYNALENRILFALPDLENDERRTTTAENLPLEDLTRKQMQDHIAEELKEITQKQDFSIEKISNAMKALEKQNGVKTFLVGNDLKVLRFHLAQIKDLISLLDVLAIKNQEADRKTIIEEQIKFLKKQEITVGGFISEHEKRFSLFGWFVKIL
jgi:hypothetical protein